jgi:bifunctional phosphoglucose/phosphomannose isomerase
MANIIKILQKQSNSTDFKFFYKERIINKKYSSLVIFGMGASGLVGDFVKNLSNFIFKDFKIPIEVIKSNGLNNSFFYNEKTLFIGISFSGNTKETIELAKTIYKSKYQNQMILVTGGGEIEKIAKKMKIPHLKMRTDKSLTSRQSIALMYNGVLNILENLFPIKKISFAFKNFEKRAATEGKKISSEIKGNIIIYTPQHFNHLGNFWKNNFNETSKNFALNSVYPEINHNEVEGLNGLNGLFTFIFLNCPEDNNFKNKIKFLKNFINSIGCQSIKIKLIGRDDFEKTWYGVLLSYYTSFYLAEKNKKNPKITKLIEKIKSIK